MTTEGLVLKREEYGDRNVYLTLLSPGEGQIRLLCKSAKTFKGSSASASQVFSYGEYDYYVKGETRILQQGYVLNDFFNIAMNYDHYLLGAYLIELTTVLTDDAEAHDDLLRCMKNGLYALQNDLVDDRIVKSALEWRMLAECGFLPDVGGCAVCRKPLDHGVFDLRHGVTVCRDCIDAYASGYTGEANPPLRRVTPSVLSAMRYTLNADPKRLFSFALEEDDVHAFAGLTEDYVKEQIDVPLPTLKYHHEGGVTAYYGILRKNDTNA